MLGKMLAKCNILLIYYNYSENILGATLIAIPQVIKGGLNGKWQWYSLPCLPRLAVLFSALVGCTAGVLESYWRNSQSIWNKLPFAHYRHNVNDFEKTNLGIQAAFHVSNGNIGSEKCIAHAWLMHGSCKAHACPPCNTMQWYSGHI